MEEVKIPYYIRSTEILLITKLSRSTIWRLEKQGLFPKRRKLSRNCVGWLSTEIEEWIKTRLTK